MTTTAPTTHITFCAGRILVCGWPAEVRPPFGLRDVGTHLEAPARLRWRVRRALEAAGLQYSDEVHAGERPRCRVPHRSQDPAAAAALLALRLAGFRGITAGLPEASRAALIAALHGIGAGTALLVAADSGAEDRWRRALDVEVRTAAVAAGEMHWLGARHDLLVIDAPELMPWPTLERVLDASAALARVATAARVDWRLAQRLAAGVGPVVHGIDDAPFARCHDLRVSLPPVVEAAYADAWSTFLAAFDRFAAARPEAGFGTFVAQARGDALQRPALSAWHAALRAAAWHEHKAAVVAELLERHRGERVLVFTPDREVAYELAREHLIAAVTAELPRHERSALLGAFAAGTLRALAGPRLLDLGVEEGSADVAILAGGGFGRDQRAARCRRVRRGGVIYQLVSLDTVEVGRVQRWRGAAAAHQAVLHGR